MKKMQLLEKLPYKDTQISIEQTQLDVIKLFKK
jgi:hypothetical protein